MSELKRITPTTTIELLIQAVNQGDHVAFYKHAEGYLQGLSSTGEAWQRIARLLNAKPVALTRLNTVPSEIKELVAQSQPVDENVFLNDASHRFVQELVTEWKHKDLYHAHNLGVRTKILLHGPTGNGKTTLVRHIARQADLPLLEVKADSVISSKLGRTGSNIGSIFSTLQAPFLLFWDEVDTIGRRRASRNSDSGEVENERMVNSMLINMEKLHPSVILIGATNRREVLDSAFLRRFDAEFELPAPTGREKESFATQLAAYHKLPPAFTPAAYDHLTNYAEVKRSIVEQARAYIVRQIKHIG